MNIIIGQTNILAFLTGGLAFLRCLFVFYFFLKNIPLYLHYVVQIFEKKKLFFPKKKFLTMASSCDY